MKNICKATLLFVICLISLSASGLVFAYQNPTANAGPDLYVNAGQTVILQGSGYDPQGSNLSYYWNCSGGTLSSYNIAQPTYTAPNYNNQNYSCSLTVTNSYSLSNSDSMTVYVNYNNGNNYGNGSLSTTKQVINLTSRNLNWSGSVNANPSDILSFAITLQANGQDVHNVIVRDILPANLIYKGNLTVNASLNYGGNPSTGINIGTIPANGVEIIAYQAQVAPASSFSYGTTNLNNSATITSTESGTQTAYATAVVNNSLVYGASTVSTGLTNNFLTDSFLLPLLLIVFAAWFYFSGEIYVFADKIKSVIRK
jgi:hypothetical protein